MPAGMSKAKARQNSKTKNYGASRARLGLPAKAGKRRPHNIKADGKGNYIAADFKPRPKVEVKEVKPYIMTETKEKANPPVGAALKEGMRKIQEMERRHGASMSDPFAFKRMRTHFKLGLVGV